MNRQIKTTCMASVGMIALCGAGMAQAQTSGASADPAVSAEQASNDDSETIIVTARRDAEKLQDIPVSVQVVTGDRLNKLAINSAEEISKLAPGLTLNSQSASTGVTLRGVTWQPGSGTPATPIYFNEAPFDPEVVIQSLFDIGQIEVLRGPQGTSRGAPSISGAVTITARKPDLYQFGGYVRLQYGEGDHAAGQGAVNLPLIEGMLAVRLAANVENMDGNRVRSVNSDIEPTFRDRTYRASVLFEPTDTLSIGAMYQRRKTFRRVYAQVAGAGSPGVPALGIQAGFNGPALTVKDRRSVQDAPTITPDHIDLLTVNANWEVFGQKLTYNFGRQFNRGGTRLLASDPLNILPGFESYNLQRNLRLPGYSTHEIRFSSTPDPDRPFDYDVGYFSKRSQGTINFVSPVFYLPGTLGGAFGPLGTPPGAVTSPDLRYVLPSSTDISLGQRFTSVYGNVRFHLDEDTELGGGLAILRDRRPIRLNITTGAARAVAAPLSALGGLPCPGIPGVFVTGLVNSNYPGFCDALVPAGIGNSLQTFDTKDSASIYNFSLSHKFSDAVLVYATTGSSFRSGLPAINNTGLPTALVNPDPEKAKSYEAGVKTTLGRGLTANVAVFQLDYKGQLTTFEGITYFNSINRAPAQTSIAFYRNVDSRVRGIEVELAARPIDNLSLAANFAYSKIKSSGGTVPCNIGAPITAANPINFCALPKGRTLNQTPPLQVTVNGSYEVPITDSFGGYFRFNANLSGKNPNFGNFPDPVTGQFRKTGSFAIIDLFAGMTGGDGAWDLGIYAKNIFDKQTELGRVRTINTIYSPYGSGGYDQVRTNQPREVGVVLRYAIGSR